MNRPSLAFCFALASLSFACSSSTSEPTPTGSKDAGVVDRDGATFTKVYAQVMQGYSCLECHVPGHEGVTEGHLDMSTQAKAYADDFIAAIGMHRAWDRVGLVAVPA